VTKVRFYNTSVPRGGGRTSLAKVFLGGRGYGREHKRGKNKREGREGEGPARVVEAGKR